MVADSGANMKAALDKFENVLKFPCAAHLINFCVHDIDLCWRAVLCSVQPSVPRLFTLEVFVGGVSFDCSAFVCSDGYQSNFSKD